LIELRETVKTQKENEESKTNKEPEDSIAVNKNVAELQEKQATQEKDLEYVSQTNLATHSL